MLIKQHIELSVTIAFLHLYKTDDIIFHEIDIIRYKVNDLGRSTHYLTTTPTPLMSVLTDKYGQYEAG